MNNQYYSTGTCACCGKYPKRLLWNLCEKCSKSMEKEFGSDWSWDPIDKLMQEIGYYEKTTEE